jgi:Domain of unknown function (DUF4395)
MKKNWLYQQNQNNRRTWRKENNMAKSIAQQRSNEEATTCNDIPMPVVKLNRWTLIVGILGGLVLQWPLVTTALFLILVPAVIYGQRGSLIFKTGKWLMSHRLLNSNEVEGEDRRLMRFNNSIATVLLGLAQVAFLLGVPVVGWALALMVVAAATAALLGFCLGCALFYRFRIYRYKLFGAR